MPALSNTYSNVEISRKLLPYFKKSRGGEYFSHLNGSDITIEWISTQKWKWSLSGRQSGHGWSKSLTEARVDAWKHTLNALEVKAFERGELSIP